MKLSIGSKAPLFSLKTKTSAGLQEVHLADQLGKKPVVILFFPFIFTGVCTDEMCSVTQQLDQYTSLGATIYAISIDNPFAQEAWAQHNNIQITLLSDFNKTAAKDYGVLYDNLLGFNGVAKRAAFVIDTLGNIAYISVSDDPKQLPDFEAIKHTLKKLQD